MKDKLFGSTAEVWQLICQNRLDEAKKMCLRPAMYSMPKSQAIFFLGYIYLTKWTLDKAQDCFKYILKKDADDTSLGNYALTLSRMGQVCDAISIVHKIKRSVSEQWSNLLLWLCHTSNDPQEILTEAKEYGRDIESKIEPIKLHNRLIKTGLRIGFVSADFYNHPVSNFIRPIMRHKPDDVSLHCYSVGYAKDDTTGELAAYADRWNDCVEFECCDIAAKIAQDNIDVLIDLGGHTNGGQHLPIFVYKPAPVQISYCGYPGTTGMSRIDYVACDKTVYAESMFDNPLLIDDCFLCYDPRKSDVPDILGVGGDCVRYGYFGRIEKVTDQMVRMWTEIMNRNRRSKLILKAMLNSDLILKRYCKLFKDLIEWDRVSVYNYSESHMQHMQDHCGIDLILDTVPYNGTTTLCDALVMGTPVITMPGNSFASRVGADIVNASGVGIVVNSEQEYIERAASIRTLVSYDDRIMNRKKVLRSKLCDAKGFSERFYAAVMGVKKC